MHILSLSRALAKGVTMVTREYPIGRGIHSIIEKKVVLFMAV
jgi:hypothetical protein